MPRDPSTGDYHPEGPDDRTAAEQSEIDLFRARQRLASIYDIFLHEPTIAFSVHLDDAIRSYHDAWITNKARGGTV